MTFVPNLDSHIRGLEEQLLRPEVRRSPHALELLLADDFTEFASDGAPFGAQVGATLQREKIF